MSDDFTKSCYEFGVQRMSPSSKVLQMLQCKVGIVHCLGEFTNHYSLLCLNRPLGNPDNLVLSMESLGNCQGATWST